MSEIIKFETPEMEESRMLREIAETNIELLKSLNSKINNPNNTPLEKAKARYLKANVERDWDEARKQGDLMERLMDHKLEVVK